MHQKSKLFQCALKLSQTSYKMRTKTHFLNLSPTETTAGTDHYLISRITEWLRLEGSVEVISPNPLARVRQLRASYLKPCPDGFGIPQRMETLQSLCPVCPSAW